MQKAQKNWYSDWFNTKFYHILYQDRDHKEAQLFMDNLTYYLNLPEGASILDLACGKGRHAIYLNSLGYDVTGTDISENSITYAKQFENEQLHFEVHDMSKAYHKKFDAVFNLFTSFGYFEDENDNLNTLKAIKSNLNETGFAVIDFMNTSYILDNLVPEEIKKIKGIDFHIKRYADATHIFKEIHFKFESKDYHYTECVRALKLEDFESYFEIANIDLLDIFGDYKLQRFDLKNSERLIMIFK
ncbi:class I SAM-dependent methyltransferase [Leptobacterium sp. I13]|uniref:class I SAM-dependent methyltransferase n=1 Tax=Leptobacterium meishanense TaxID=3128904 RepID=UPI0030EC759C